MSEELDQGKTELEQGKTELEQAWKALTEKQSLLTNKLKEKGFTDAEIEDLLNISK